MDRLSNEIKLIKLKIERNRIFLHSALYNKEINEEELFNLINNKKIDLKKEKILIHIYFSPFVLFDQELLSDNIKKILPDFLEYRYNMEMEELEFLYKRGDINKQEYIKSKDLINFCYYESSLEGKKIRNTNKKIKMLV